MTTVHLIPTGTANLASVRAAFTRLGATIVVTRDPHAIADAPRVVLPGVGAFGASMEEVHPLADAIRARVAQNAPLLAVCVGLHLLCSASEESPGVEGLGIVPATVARFKARPGLRVPHMGWASVAPTANARWIKPGYAYFAHSYRLPDLPPGWDGARADHGEPFVAALEQGSLLALQFHPELSGAWGEELLGRWLRAEA